MPIALALAPARGYLKIGAIALAIAGAGYAAWTVKGAFAEREKVEAVSQAVDGINKQLQEEKDLRIKYETQAETRIAELLKSISILQDSFKTVSSNVGKERTSNPKFYEQALPDGGYQQWKKAKELVQSSNPPATQP